MDNDFDGRSDSHAGGRTLPAWHQNRWRGYYPSGGLILILAIPSGHLAVIRSALRP